MRARKKQIEIDFIELTESNIKDVYLFIHPNDKFPESLCEIARDKWWEYEQIVKKDGMDIYTLESGKGTQIASMGDIIIKGVQGEFYPCKPDIFKLTYDII